MTDERDDPEFDPKLRARLENLVPDAVKKLALAGVGALFMTEEGIRNVLGDMKLPREAVGNVLSQTEKARNELFKMIAVELRKFLEHSNLSGEMAKALTGLTVDIDATVSFRSTEGGDLIPAVKTKVTTRPNDDWDDEGDADDGAVEDHEEEPEA